jgi:hypothetical protein
MRKTLFLPLFLESTNNNSDTGIHEGDSNDANNNIIHSYQALNILAEVISTF